MLWSEEWEAISHQADNYGVDAIWIATIRKVEAGPPGFEFGAKNAISQGYDAQLRSACATVRNHMLVYPANPFKNYSTGAVHLRMGYNEKFIRYFGDIWAPRGDPDDVDRLNFNWIPNALSVYPKLMIELIK